MIAPNAVSVVLTGHFFQMGNSKMQVHAIGKNHTQKKVIACKFPLISNQMKYESHDSEQKKQCGQSVTGPLFRHPTFRHPTVSGIESVKLFF